MRPHLFSATLVALLAACAQQPLTPVATPDQRPPLLAALDGNWTMTGDVRGKPVTYDMTATRTLGGTFTELHMKDTQVPPKYEARVFLGYDKDSGQVIAHWLDSFGAKFSIPHGTGQLSDNTIQFIFPYSDGPFRDTLSFDPAKQQWRLLIEASQSPDVWKDFAHYEIKRGAGSTR